MTGVFHYKKQWPGVMSAVGNVPGWEMMRAGPWRGGVSEVCGSESRPGQSGLGRRDQRTG